MSFTESAFLLVAMMLGTLLPRLLPMGFLAKRAISKNVQIWLSYVPVAILSALLAPEIFMKKGELWLSSDNAFLLAFLPVLVVAYSTKSLFATLSVGMILVASMRYFGIV